MREVIDKFVPTKPTVIVFSALWCGTCKEILPKLLETERHYGDQIDFVHVGCDNATQALLDQFNVDELPSIHVWRNPEWEHTDLEGAVKYCIGCHRARGVDYYTRSDVERLCKVFKKDIKDFDNFIYGQGAPVCPWEEEQYCYFTTDVDRFLGASGNMTYEGSGV